MLKSWYSFECPCSIERNWLGRNDINPLSLLWNLFLLQAEKINYHPSDMKLIGIFHWIKYITMSRNLSSFKSELRNGYQTNNRHYHLHTFHLKRLLKLGNTQVVNCSLYSWHIKGRLRLGDPSVSEITGRGLIRRVRPAQACRGLLKCSHEGGELASLFKADFLQF